MALSLNNICPCCGNYTETGDFSVDHIVPLSLGGTNYISNIQPLCVSCNVKKNARIVNYLDAIPSGSAWRKGESTPPDRAVSLIKD
jgi:5-methylcytosine-specific restriction endonuclease McrA